MENKIKENSIKLKHILLTFGVVLTLWLFTWVLTIYILDSWGDRGTFGDMFGSVNALFSGLAFAGVLIALFMQKNVLELQRQELADNRAVLEAQKDELKGQKEQLIIQNKQLQNQYETAELQRFENTFFKLLENLYFEIKILEEKLNNKHPFQMLANSFQFNSNSWNVNIDVEIQKGDFEKRFLSELNNFPRSFLPYIKILFTIIKFVDESNVPSKIFYTNIIKYKLTSAENILLFYYGFSNLGSNDKILIERYGLISNLPKYFTNGNEIIKENFYNELAFED